MSKSIETLDKKKEEKSESDWVGSAGRYPTHFCDFGFAREFLKRHAIFPSEPLDNRRANKNPLQRELTMKNGVPL